MAVHIPTSIEEAVSILHAHPSSMLLSGGTDVMVEVNFNHRKPQDVIALRSVSELKTWTINNESGTVFIGSGVPYAEMESGELQKALPALAAAARTVGSPQIRAAGTLGGNLGTCSPAGDSLPVLSALNAVVHLSSSNGTREVPFANFMVGPKRNARETGEIITGVTLPISNGWQGYSKVGVRNAMVISVASACLAVQDNSVRLALGSVGPVIIRCVEAEEFINTHLRSTPTLSPDIISKFAEIAGNEARPIDDHRSTAAYRKHAITVLAKRLLERSAQS
jgi:CO/xanthine dehydrogenase FAD-binding subunit